MKLVLAKQKPRLLVRLFAFVWHVRLLRVLLRWAGMDYNKFMLKMLKTKNNFDENLRYEVQRRYWFGTMKLDLAKPTQRSIFFEKEYEHHVVKFVKQHVHPGSTFVDIGAHVGYYTLMASFLTGPSGRVFSFEPDVANHQRLLLHTQLNARRNITVFKLAVSDKAGRLDFLVNPYNDGGHSVQAFAGYHPLRTEKIQAVALDDMVSREFGGLPIDCVKIDVEGHQLHVLRGMRTILRVHRPKLIVEISQTDDEGKETFHFLKTEGYTYCQIDQLNFFFALEVKSI